MPGPSALLVIAAIVALLVGVRATRRSRGARAGVNASPDSARLLMMLSRVPCPRALVRLLGGGDPTKVLAAAGMPVAVWAPVVPRARCGGVLVGAVTGGVLAVFMPPLVVVVPLAAIAGRLTPDRLLARRARERRDAILTGLPDLLDLMVICVGAGMALDPALGISADRLGGILGAEVRTTLGEQSLGTPRRAAYRSLADRTGSPDLGRLVGALLQAEELGTPLSSALAGQAEALRASRRQRARDRAARAAPRIQLVVALVMVPGALILVLGVMLIELASQVGAVTGVGP